MSDSNETNQLLTQIRDLIAQREQADRDHLQQSLVQYDEQLNKSRQSFRLWVTWIFVVIYGAVYLAIVTARQ